MAEYSDATVTAFYAELKRQARGKATIDGMHWTPLEAIAGEKAYKVFQVLRDRGWIRTRVLAGCYGHEVHDLLTP